MEFTFYFSGENPSLANEREYKNIDGDKEL